MKKYLMCIALGMSLLGFAPAAHTTTLYEMVCALEEMLKAPNANVIKESKTKIAKNIYMISTEQTTTYQQVEENLCAELANASPKKRKNFVKKMDTLFRQYKNSKLPSPEFGFLSKLRNRIALMTPKKINMR